LIVAMPCLAVAPDDPADGLNPPRRYRFGKTIGLINAAGGINATSRASHQDNLHARWPRTGCPRRKFLILPITAKKWPPLMTAATYVILQS
jgi:hypothetical protein